MESSTTPSAPAGGQPAKGSLDYLNDALEHLKKASGEASGDVRSSIDEAVKEIRDAYEETSKKARDKAEEWLDDLQEATEDVRRQLAKLAIRAQDSEEALDEVEKEVVQRRTELKAGAGEQ